MAGEIVYLVGPESSVYHTRRDCPALQQTYWPVERGKVKRDGSIVTQAIGQPQYTGRRACKRCPK